MQQRLTLPIDALLPRIVESLARHPSLVLQAAPGTGKTTRVPPALLSASFLDARQEILVLEPRRLAAKMSARRVAQEMGQAVGETVGYQFRFENVSSPRTRLRYLTEGMLMRRLIGDPQLRGVSCVVLDEFHERHLHSDVSLAFLRRLQRGARPDLRIVVMSATLDIGSLAEFLGDSAPAPVIEAPGKQYEVTVEYLPSAPAKHLDLTVRDAVASLLPRTTGDVLVFLPGMGEIRRAEQALGSVGGLVIAPLHGELSREEQDAAIRPLERGSGRRKVILSTNVAETSLTIEGVGVVVDSGLHRQASHSYWSGVPALKTKATSRASAVQRAGRAGRTGPGHCLRLYTRGDFDGRPMFDAPEIQRADLAQTLLELAALGVGDPARFEWFERPQAQALEASRDLLVRLGALEPTTFALTARGRRMAELPAHPRIARMLIEAERAGVLEDAATFAAYFMEGRVDHLDALDVLRQARMEESVWRVRTHLLSAFGARGATAAARSAPATANASDKLRFALLCGFPDRVARLRPGQDLKAQFLELLFSSGGSARIENTAALGSADTFIILDIQQKQHAGQARAQTQVQSLCEIREEWLFDLDPTLLREVDEPVWDPARKRVLASSRLAYDQLTLSESRKDLSEPSPAAAALMLKEGLGLDEGKLASFSIPEILRALAPVTEPEALESLLARVSLVARNFAEYGLHDFAREPHAWGPMLKQVVASASSLEELRGLDWEGAVLAAGTPSGDGLSSHQLEELVPQTVTLPSGRKPRVQYKLDQAPWVESRLQDFFGLKRGPSILRGRAALTLHLLAPNGRAVQVTTDLEGFWQRAYPELRHALSRRYPRHQWPEKP